MTERQIIINLVTGFYLHDHLGDASDDMMQALKLIGIKVPDDCYDMRDIGKWLAQEYAGETIWGSSVLDD